LVKHHVLLHYATRGRNWLVILFTRLIVSWPFAISDAISHSLCSISDSINSKL